MYFIRETTSHHSTHHFIIFINLPKIYIKTFFISSTSTKTYKFLFHVLKIIHNPNNKNNTNTNNKNKNIFKTNFNNENKK
jgi:hypothetical protein